MLRMNVRDNEATPTLYRLAWYDYQIRRAVCYPLGIHWIAWAIRWLWMWTYRQTWPDAFERACADIYTEVRKELENQSIDMQRDWNDMQARLLQLRKENAELREAIRRYVLQVSAPPTPEELEAMGGKPETPPPPPPPKKTEGPGIWIIVTTR
jgi:hypothetical protein